MKQGNLEKTFQNLINIFCVEGWGWLKKSHSNDFLDLVWDFKNCTT